MRIDDLASVFPEVYFKGITRILALVVKTANIATVKKLA